MIDASHYKVKFKELYRKLGIMHGCSPLPLHTNCEKRRTCWGKGRVTKNRVPEYSSITLPHVGEEYDSTKLVVIGVNNRANWEHDDGTKVNIHSEATGVIDEAKRILTKGKSKFYLPLAEYCTILLTRTGKLNGTPEDNIKNRQVLARVLEKKIVLVQSVKCNPKENQAEYPRGPMFKECPKHILLRELHILKPRHILILGLENFDHIIPVIRDYLSKKHNGYRPCSSPHPRRWKQIMVFEYHRYRRGKKDCEHIIIGVRHPSYGSPNSVKTQLMSIPFP